MRGIFFLAFFLFITTVLQAQSYTVSGFVSDANSGERLMYASVYDKNTKIGCSTNEYGYFSFIVHQKDIQLSTSYIGYKENIQTFSLNKDTVLNIVLEPASAFEIQEVLVTDRRAQKRVESSQMSEIQMSIKKIKELPIFMGEADVIKTLQLMPGVQSGQEGTSGIFVRGGSADQNLILLDGVPVYNSDHLFGFFSVFNPDAISSVKMIKGGFPARYSGRLSSVVDIRMKEGNLKKFHGEGSVGLISSKITLEGPIIKNKTGFLISARRTYIDLLTAPLIAASSGSNEKAGYFFYDINAKIHHQLGKKDKLFFSVYGGRDRMYSKFNSSDANFNNQYKNKGETNVSWGNFISSIRWNHIISPNIFSNTTLVFSDYRFVVEDKTSEKSSTSLTEYKMDFVSGIQDIGLKTDIDFNRYSHHKIKAGASYLFHTFNPGVTSTKESSDKKKNTQSFGNKKLYANEYSLYIEDNWRAGSFLTNIGLHYSGLILNKGFYHLLQPRISTRFLINENISLKLAYSRMQQYLHLLSNSTIGLPTDLWMPCTDEIHPQLSNQIALGMNWNINQTFDLNIESFYKDMSQLITYKPGASFFEISNNWQDKLEVGKGNAYGVEVLLRKNYGKITGWLAYTLSWAWRQFDNINFGKKYPYKYDRRHDISIALTYKPNNHFDMGISWVYGTGNAITLPLARYKSLTGYERNKYSYPNMIDYHGSKNSYRMPSYQRLDLSFNFRKKKKWGTRVWSFGLYNAYNRHNPFILFFENDDEEQKYNLMSFNLFPVLPFIRYSFKF